jgi:hypothetical protein
MHVPLEIERARGHPRPSAILERLRVNQRPFWYTKSNATYYGLLVAVVAFARLDSSPPFLPTVYLREI